MNQEETIREIEGRYRQLGRSLNELERRHWAATEAMRIGHGGITIVSKALRISRNTIKRGIQEIVTGELDAHSQVNARIRKPGGGRKSKTTSSEPTIRTPFKKSSTDNNSKPFPANQIAESPPNSAQTSDSNAQE